MKLQVLLLIAFAAGIAACAEKEQAAAPTESEVEAPEAAATEMPAAEALESVEEELDTDPDATLAEVEEWRTEALLDHMHAHAEHLDDLNYALDDGDLDRASMAAYWLSRHETIAGLPDRLQPFVAGLRESARAVEAAEDVAAARSAAQQIGVACQGCHTAADVVLE